MKCLRVTMPDGSRWDVPAWVILENRRCHYGEPAFEEIDDYDLKDWAAGNMDWKDVVEHARKVIDRPPMSADEFQEGWVNGTKEVVEVRVVEGVAFVPLTDVGPPHNGGVRGVTFPCEACGAKEGSTLDNGFYRCNACGYPGK